jgi:hypothetical protein
MKLSKEHYVNKELELEAEKYVENNPKFFAFGEEYTNYDVLIAFIAGAESKYSEKQKLEFAIKQVRKVMNTLHLGSSPKSVCLNKAKELRQQISKL